MQHTKENIKWKTILDSQGEVLGIETEHGRLVASFNSDDSPLFRAAVAKNILWVQQCIVQDIERYRFSFKQAWKHIFKG